MRINPVDFLIVWTIGATIIVANLAVDHRIVRHVCKREGRPYTWLWWTSLYWHWRILRPSWFLKEAKEAGFPVVRALLLGALIVFYVACFYFKPVRVFPS